MNDEANSSAHAEEKDIVPAERPLRVLVVDDDKDVATAIARALESLGHAAVNCGHAQEALDGLPGRASTCCWSITACPT